jgi:hypothetical protein
MWEYHDVAERQHRKGVARALGRFIFAHVCLL